MRKPLAILLVALLAIAVLFVIGPFSGGDAPPPDTFEDTVNNTALIHASMEDQGEKKPAPALFTDSGTRVEVEDQNEALDPSVVAALSGFRGRIIDHKKTPVPDSLVSLYRFAPDVVMNPGKSIFVEDENTHEPEIDAGEVRTDENGCFELTGIWPRAFYLFRAGADQGSPTLRIVQRVPSPGEIVDIGDIELIECGTISGTVVDPDGEPVASALVRAVDLPGAILSMVPLQRIDPEGALIVRERDVEIALTFPSWVKRRFDQLPIARTRTDSEGNFQVEGVPAGGNLVAITHPEWLSVVKARVVVKAGKDKNLGRLRMPEGEVVMGKVVDMEDKPIPGAEILVASENSLAPVHFASYAKPSATDGTFSFPGVPPKNVVVAARRHKGEPWTISEPTPATADIVIRLPSEHEIHVTLLSAIGEEITNPRFQLTEGQAENGAVVMAMWGVTRPIQLDGRISKTEEGVYVIKGIPEGDYVLLAQAPGHAAKATDIDLKEKNEVAITLTGQVTFDVAVVDERGKAIVGATVYVEAHGERPRLPDFPLNSGRTRKDGIVHVDQVQATEIRITAQHPAFGTAHSESQLPPTQPIVLTMLDPGALAGTLTEGSADPTPGKWTITIERRRSGNDIRGAMPDIPRLITPDLKGHFEVTGLKPGKYRLQVFTTLEMIKSPGKAMGLAETMFMMPQLPRREVEVHSGQTARIQLDALEKKNFDGPSALVTGTVTINGRLMKNLIVTGRGNGHRVREAVDAQGRFQLGPMPIGNLSLSVVERSGNLFTGSQDQIFNANYKLEAGADLDVTVDITTTGAEGFVVDANGNPVADARVQLSGQLKTTEGKYEGHLWRHEQTDKNGQFSFERIPVGKYNFTANINGAEGKSKEIVLDGANFGTGIQIQLAKVYTARGTVDMSVFGEKSPEYMWLAINSTVGTQVTTKWGHVDKAGNFEVQDLTPGEYSIAFNTNSRPPKGFKYTCDQTLSIVADDIKDIVLRPRLEAVQPPKPAKKSKK